MELSVVYIHVSSLILQTIRKSESVLLIIYGLHSYDFVTTECYLQLYEIMVLLPVLGVLLRNLKWTRQVQNGIVNSVRRIFINTYLTMFAQLGMLYTEERLLLVVL